METISYYVPKYYIIYIMDAFGGMDKVKNINLA